MVNYKCVLVKTKGTDRKTRSDKGETHKKGEGSKVMREKKETRKTRSDKGETHKMPDGKIMKGKKHKEVKKKAPIKKKSPAEPKKTSRQETCDRNCQRARERNLGSGKQTSLDMLKRY